ncbi:HtaA domain-containing protein, partial [Streptomyces sp. SID3212]|uniref:HtaA domain-containing protein n=1 Tax=Streptomyces sp. SID3212 TaxID=2690259 RepID=UPI0013CC144A
PTPTPTEAPDHGDVADGQLGWGVKESFRSYVVDGAANGKISTADGASQATGNGDFTFTDGTGAYDLDADTLAASFAGSVTFKGHESAGSYGLDLTLSGLRVELDGGTGTLSADVDSLGKTSQDVVLADLKATPSDLKAIDDVISLEDIAATLTGPGAKAFGGFYTAGTALDPVDLDLALSEAGELPGGSGTGGSGTGGNPDTGGTTGTTGGTTEGSTGGSTTGAATTAGGTTGSTPLGTGNLASTGADIPTWFLGTASALTVAAGAAMVVVSSRRRSATQNHRA